MEQYYTPSGKLSPLAFGLWILAAIIAFPLLACIYAYAIWYIPIPYLNLFITGIFGYLVGLVVAKLVVKIGKVRSVKWAVIFSLFGALTALYIHWAIWVDLAFNITDTIGSDTIGIATSNIKFTEVLSLIIQPGALFGLMGDINTVGVWGIRGGTVSGGFLTAIWIIEIVIVTLVAIMISVGQAAKPYCEEENDWFQENDLNPVAHFADVPAIVKALAAGDMEVLSAHLKPAVDIESQHHAKITLYDAKSGENFVTIENQIGEISDKGEVKFNTEDVTTFLKISQEVADQLKSVS